jgi:hypothetical protein
MTKDDRQFITQLFGDLNGKIDRVNDGVRHNGILIEHIESYNEESQKVWSAYMDRVDRDLAYIKNAVSDLPAIRLTVKSHSKRLAALEK